MTGMGVILGTAAYMAPEQARGKVVDKRADIWAFGVCSTKCSPGAALFDDETVSDTLAAVLKETPTWEGVPARALPLLRRCLEKDPKRRLRDIGDAMALLEEAPQSATAAPSVPTCGVAVAGRGGAARRRTGLAGRRPLPRAAAGSTRAHAVPDPASRQGRSRVASPFAVSPDGRNWCSPPLVRTMWPACGFGRSTRSRRTRSPVRKSRRGFLSRRSGRPTAGSWPSTTAEGSSRRSISRAVRRKRCGMLPRPIVGGSWNRDGVIIFALVNGGLMRVSAAGGVASPTDQRLTHPGGKSLILFPSFLPGRAALLVLRFVEHGLQGAAFTSGSLEVKPEEQSSKLLLQTTSGPVPYVPLPDSVSASFADNYCSGARGRSWPNLLMTGVWNCRASPSRLRSNSAPSLRTVFSPHPPTVSWYSGPAAQPVRAHSRPGLTGTGRVWATPGSQAITSAWRSRRTAREPPPSGSMSKR